jgi:DMSO/TMAO reductase YedYZ heme-binding membrane subunit
VNPHLAWYVARATGIVAWALLTVAVVWGLLLSTHLLGRRPTPRWLLDLHRFLGGLALAFTGLHVAALVADTTTSFGPAAVLVPFASSWKPGPVALGVVALHLLVAVEFTSLVMRRIPRRWWRSVHATSFAAFWLATIHLVTAGTDAAHPALVLAALAAAGAVVFLTAYRLLADRRLRPAPARA